MKSRYTLVAILALGSVGIQGADSKPLMKDAQVQTDFTPDTAMNYLEHVAHKPEPSFFKKTAHQFAIGAAFTLGGYLITIAAKRYFTSKAEHDKEAAHATATEQNILKNLEADIKGLMEGLPKRQKDLELAKNPEEIEYLKTIISKGEELLQKKMAMHAALSQKFEEDQARRYEEQLRRVGTTQQSTSAA